MSESPGGLAGTTTKLKGIRRAAARQMVKAWEAPQFSLGVGVDMTSLLGRKSEGSTVTDLLVAAVTASLLEHPGVNAWYGEDGITTFDRVNIGLAVATEGGLVVPVIHDTQARDVAAIAEGRRDVVAKAREGRLGFDDVSGATFTISNLGMSGIDRFTAIVNPPQVAILAIGATRDRLVRDASAAEPGAGVWRPYAELTLSCDHRALDGAAGAAFLATLRERIETD